MKFTFSSASKMIITFLISKDNYQSKVKHISFWFNERKTITFPVQRNIDFFWILQLRHLISSMIILMTSIESCELISCSNLRGKIILALVKFSSKSKNILTKINKSLVKDQPLYDLKIIQHHGQNFEKFNVIIIYLNLIKQDIEILEKPTFKCVDKSFCSSFNAS